MHCLYLDPVPSSVRRESWHATSAPVVSVESAHCEAQGEPGATPRARTWQVRHRMRREHRKRTAMTDIVGRLEATGKKDL